MFLGCLGGLLLDGKMAKASEAKFSLLTLPVVGLGFACWTDEKS
jgi:hypothetical protein